MTNRQLRDRAIKLRLAIIRKCIELQTEGTDNQERINRLLSDYAYWGHQIELAEDCWEL